MRKKDGAISERWIKASVIGTIWAASEIVLGSFLHNLKVPFSGNILTGIGLIILISALHVWKDRGLIWRAGVICALMKTLSPSAFIFGPMIAIFFESAILELNVRILGRTLPGFISGSMMAMSWNLVQKAANLIIFYGNNLIDLYSNMVKYAERQLNIQFDIFWLPLIILLVLYSLFGAVSGLIGIRVGRRVIAGPADTIGQGQTDCISAPGKKKQRFNYSVVWLIADITAMAGLLILVGSAEWKYYCPAVAVAVVIWSIRYRRALRQISKPKFWIFFVVITMLSAIIFTSVQNGPHDYVQGLLIGLEMNFRAIVVIVGFTVLGTELYNPLIRNLFLKTYFRQLPVALELSAATLPAIIASVPDLKTIIRNPVSILYGFMSGIEERLNEIRQMVREQKKVFILSGEIGEGKTTFLREILECLDKAGFKTGGVYSPRIIKEEKTSGYDIVNIQTGERSPFLSVTGHEDQITIGRFYVNDKGLATGNEALDPDKLIHCNLVVVDEIGPLELKDQGWAERVTDLLGRRQNNVLLIVRKYLVDEVMRKWGLYSCHLSEIKKSNYSDICDHIINELT